LLKVPKRGEYTPTKRLRNNVSRTVSSAIWRVTGKQTWKSIWKTLPYSPTQLKKHIENQFQQGMTWDNWGNTPGCWNIDHIYPQSRLLYDSVEHPNFQKCWSLKNLQPMWWEENVAKSDSIVDK
tara:strand:+ start:576 stop:947 length:372 start_codon:yes stop_codon:yes gene_type:complete